MPAEGPPPTDPIHGTLTVTCTPDLGEVGQSVRIAMSLAADPATLTLTVTKPDSTTTVVPIGSLTWLSTGVYVYDYATTAAGDHSARAVSTVPAAADTAEFLIVGTSAPVSLDDAKAHVGKTNTTDDAELQRMLNAAMTRIAYEVGPLSPQTFVEDHTDDAPFILRKQPATGFTSATVTPLYSEFATDLAPATATWRLVNGMVHRTSGWSAYGPSITTVTYTAGWNPLPEDIHQAVLELTRHMWATQQGSRLRSQSPTQQLQGTQDMLLQAMSYTLPNRVKELLEPYRQRTRVA